MGALGPRDTKPRVVMLLPFPASALAERPWHDPAPIAIDGVAGGAGSHDLMFQRYSTDLSKDMREALPHRTGSAELPSWPGARLDRWSVDVVCLWVEEVLDGEFGDWQAYRRQADVRREAVRERAEAELGPEPLWLLLLHVIEAEAARDALDEVARTLTDNGEPCALDAFPDVVVRLALTQCVAIPPARLDVAAGVARMSEVHTAIWASAVEFDRELLRQLARTTEKESLPELERHVDGLRETSRRVRAFRAPLANTAAHLSELDGPLWRGIADRWELEPQLDALSGRIDALQHMHTDLIAAVTSKHAQRLNKIALALALISGCTAIFAVWQFVIAEPGPTEVRVANALVVAAVAALAVWLWRLSVARARS